jgi:hypothetical protein
MHSIKMVQNVHPDRARSSKKTIEASPLTLEKFENPVNRARANFYPLQPT